MILSPRKLLDKLLVACPNVDHCQDVMPRRDLHSHLIYSCRGTKTNCVNADIGCNFHGTRAALQRHIDQCLYNDTGKRLWRVIWTPILEEEVTTIEIYASSSSLGVSVVGGVDTPLINIVIQEVFLNGAAYKDGRLLPGDQLIAVNGIDMTKASHNQAIAALSCPSTTVYQLDVYREPAESDVTAHGLIQNDDVTFTSSHQNYDNQQTSSDRYTPDSVVVNDDVTTSSRTPRLVRNPTDGAIPLVTWPPTDCRVKVVTVATNQSNTLGIGIAGGRFSCGYDTPIYVTNIQPGGCLSKTGQICRGDILLAVNGTSLLNLTHNEAVQILKASSMDSRRILHVLQVGRHDVDISAPGTANFRPVWTYWLSLPSVCYSVKTITLERSMTGSLGFSIVGGYRTARSADGSSNHTVPVFVKSVLPNSPAGKDGRLRSGDMIISVDGHSVDGATHDDVARLLTRRRCDTAGFVVLAVVSWPGSAL